MKPIISILMSIYNETESWIKQSVESILAQTMQDFEFIIVSDNPNRADVEKIVMSYGDSRIIYLQNEQNIGLALSMNRAAAMASTDVYVRMDADDIAEPTRLQKEFEIIKEGKYDLIFSQFTYIDENSKNIDRLPQPYYPPEGLSRQVLLRPIIHHPTVMFTKSIFEQAGGYRDFPCSQDLDLWFRMAEAGCRFYMINAPLLKYRVTNKSTTSTRWFQQHLTEHYIYELSIERLKNNGKDSFSKEHYHDCLISYGLNSEHSSKALKKAQHNLSRARKEYQSGNKMKAFYLRFMALAASSAMRRLYINMQRKKYLINRL